MLATKGMQATISLAAQVVKSLLVSLSEVSVVFMMDISTKGSGGKKIPTCAAERVDQSAL